MDRITEQTVYGYEVYLAFGLLSRDDQERVTRILYDTYIRMQAKLAYRNRVVGDLPETVVTWPMTGVYAWSVQFMHGLRLWGFDSRFNLALSLYLL